MAEMVPTGHWRQVLAADSVAFVPTLQGSQESPPMPAVPGEHATHVPAVAATKDDCST